MKRLNLRRALVSLATVICAIAGVATMQARADIVFTGDIFVTTPPAGEIIGPGPLVIGGSLTVGNFGIGSLLINGTNTLTTDIAVLAQGSFDTFGAATLTGMGAVWNTNILNTGNDGMGVLNIWDGATVNITAVEPGLCNPCDVFIAVEETSTGIVSVQGMNSLLGVAAELDVGLGGRGFLTIVDGGVVNAGTGFPASHNIAGNAGSSGTVIVQGTDSEFNLTGRLTVGNAENATGTVNISNFGAVTVTNGSLSLGNSPGASGIVNITNSGTLTLTRNIGGSVSSRSTIGNEGSGIVTVSGVDSMLTFEGVDADGVPYRPRIGERGFGALHVSDGGQVLINGTLVAAPVLPATRAETTGFSLGRNINSVGVLTVSGLGSLVTVDGRPNARVRVQIGGVRNSEPPSLTGTMVIMDGGKVVILAGDSNSAVPVGARPRTVGMIRVSGTAGDLGVDPSTLDIVGAGNRLCLGLSGDCVTEAGIGTLIVEDGGVVTVDILEVGTQGQILGSGGTINVGGATLTNGGLIRPGGIMTIIGEFEQKASGTIVLNVNGTGEGEFDQLVLTGGTVTLNGTIEVVVAEDVDLTGEGSLKLVDTTGSSSVEGTADVMIMNEGGDLIASFQSTDGSGLTFNVVAIDIKPGSDTNSINLGSNGVVPVAILSSATFDATTVDPTSVKLASAGAKMRGNGTLMSSIEDVNGDGLDDLVIQVETTTLGLTSTATEATLTGITIDGSGFSSGFTGMDLISVVPEGN